MFDEIEKAHPDVFNMLLQILEDGRLTDAKGRHINFKNTIVIMTSNLGSELILEATEKGAFGFSTDENAAKDSDKIINEKIMEVLRDHFKPEFLNRVDEIITFHSLKEKEIELIVDLQLAKVIARLEEKKIKIKINEKTKKYLAEKGYNPVFGARPLKRVIQSELLDPLALEIIEGKIQAGSSIIVELEKNNLSFKTK